MGREDEMDFILKIIFLFSSIFTPIGMILLFFAPNPEGPGHASITYQIVFESVLFACWIFSIGYGYCQFGWFKFLDKFLDRLKK